MKSFISRFFNRIVETLSVNFGWKVFSVVFAACIWFVVINITNPKETWSFTMKLTLSGVENLSEAHNVVVRNQRSLEDTTVSVQIRGKRLDLENLYKYRSGIIASANLGVLYDFTMNGDVWAPIDIIYPSLPGIMNPEEAFGVTAKSPQYARITLEEIITEERQVKVALTGDAAEGYVALVPEVVPDTVKLRGPRSRLRQIDQVLVEAPLAGETEDMRVSLKPRLLDRDMQEVQDVDCFIDMVDVFIKIDKFKQVPVIADYVGEPAEGYIVTGIDWTPRQLEIVGTEAEVDEFKIVRVSPINAAGLTKTYTASFDVRNLDVLPEAVSIRNGTPNNVTITVNIEQVVEERLTIPVAMLSTGTLSPQYSYNVLGENVEFSVGGVESAVSAITNDNIKLRIDLNGYETGEHVVPVDIQLPVGVSLVGEAPSVRVNVTNAPIPSEAEGAEVPVEAAGSE